ncbi:MAG TPA: EAL domain-containing protein [Pyrinomonadaceae bacterium]|jgi:diguanylate cyclase (GGDEF)-like protein/PAS domain S-box-containing protein
MNKQKFHQFYLRLIIALGALVCLSCLWRLDPSRIDVRFLIFAAVTICFGSRLGIEFSKHRVQVTVSDSFIFLTLFLYDAELAVLLAAAEALCSSLRFSKVWLIRLFNAGLLALSTFITASVVSYLFGDLVALGHGAISGDFITAVCLIGFVQFLVNSSMPALRQSLKLDLPVLQVWKENYLWTSITYFAGASAAGLTAKLINGNGFYAFIAMIPIIAIIYFTYQTYRKQLLMTLAQAEQAERHAEEQRAISQALRESIEEQKVISQALRKSEEHFRSAFDYAAVGMALTATDGRWLSVNRSLCQLVGYTEEELLRTNFQSITHPDDLGANLADLYQMLEGKIVTSTREKRYIHKKGHVVWTTVSASSVFDEQGKPMHFIVQAQDITERKLAEEQLHRAAFYDPLTELPNRALFRDHLGLALGRSAQHPDHLFAVLFLDIDRFKNINDSLGHVVGDQLLTAVAARLRTCVRPQDTVSRFGGDEFAVLLNGVQHSADTLAITERILREIEAPFRLSGYDVFTSASIGVALSAVGYDGTEEILRDADTAMYRAKEQGKGRFEVFDKVMHARAVSRLKMESDLRQALERGEFEVYYQPIIDLATGSLSGFEALLRWQHPERGMHSPAEFIPVAEDTELIIPIGEWVLHEACRQVREWQKTYPSETPLTISVNLSGKQFKQPDLVGQVKQVLYRTGLDPHCLRLEITESMVMDDAEAATAMLRQLRSLNVQLSIDDFGTGYSSLSYLHRFPVNILKIDRSFVGRMSMDEESLGIVETVITLASKLKMSVIAEGIETEEQWQKLKALRCPYGQGYLFSKPVPAETAATLINDEWQRRVPSRLAAEASPPDEVELLNGSYSM